MIRTRANILLAAILFLSLFSKAQQYHYTALLDTVKATGFYHIVITPELSSYLKPDLSDLRIVNEKKQNIPFIVYIPYGEKAIDPVLFDQKILKKENTKDKTILTIENERTQELSHFIVKLKSAAAERTASLSGSDDNTHWFVILDSLLLHRSGEYDSASHSQRINFPQSNYKYFRLIINNWKKEPLNILHVGSYGIDSPFETPEFVFANPVPAFSQRDSAGYSLVTITNDRPFHINKIKLNIAGTWLYQRQAKLFTKLKPGLAATWNTHGHAGFTLSSDQFSGYPIPPFKSKVFYLLINNGDNPPLKITSVTTEQVKRRVIAQLEGGASYSLLLDNPQATAQDYDLEHFRDRIPENTVITVKKITALPQMENLAPKKHVPNRWIWPAIILIVLLLALLAWKLTTDMKKT
jgi:hypothetical protein